MKKSTISLKLLGVNLREAQDSDKLKIYNWRNLDHVRSWMRESDLISMRDHLEWFRSIDQKKKSY